MANLNLFFWIRTDKSKWEILHKQAQELKDENPDKAINLLRKVETIQKKEGVGTLSTRLEIVTILYSHDRNDEAEAMLFDELGRAQEMKVGPREIKAAEKRYKDRIAALKQSSKFMGEKPKDYELKKSGDEFPDWGRNLYCKSIYSKFRIFYERIKQYEKAVPFAMAEAYAEYENHVHGFSMYGDPISPEFKAVLRCLKRCNREAEMPELEKKFWRYAEKPDSAMCWQMLDELRKLFSA